MLSFAAILRQLISSTFAGSFNWFVVIVNLSNQLLNVVEKLTGDGKDVK
jgi:hypothetical protein